MDQLSPDVEAILDEYRQAVTKATEQAAKALRELPPTSLLGSAWDDADEPQDFSTQLRLAFSRGRDFLARQRGD